MDLLAVQLSEFEILEAMYVEEFSYDQDAVASVRHFVDNHPKGIASEEDISALPQIMLKVAIPIENACCIELEARLPHRYPDDLPSLMLRSESMSRECQSQMNSELNLYVQTMKEQTCMIACVLWVQENASSFLHATAPQQKPKENVKGIFELELHFLFFHHIYNKTKKKHIVDWARELHLSGFAVYGKPGVVCIEGYKEDVNEYVQRLRGLSWKKISSRIQQTVAASADPEGLTPHRKFKTEQFDVIAFGEDNDGTSSRYGRVHEVP
eukprot:TRINITY_DN12808_c0_g1_i1.p1 TRINITY_DN12808_c0_g1~~TRINITY_DN12808_c0_g1_i1.p1  ORF type:complete len:268 (-),score=5.29 TRINITY_DN12808_c0_g1_i1:90-893(-)